MVLHQHRVSTRRQGRALQRRLEHFDFWHKLGTFKDFSARQHIEQQVQRFEVAFPAFVHPIFRGRKVTRFRKQGCQQERLVSHQVRWPVFHEPGEQFGFGKARDCLRAIANELFELRIQDRGRFAPAPAPFQRTHSSQCLRELLNHPQNVIAPNHREHRSATEPWESRPSVTA